MLRFLGLLFIAISFQSFANENVYRLGAGDLISISVYDEPDLSLELRIGLSGTISYPLLGDVDVQGLSPKQLELKLLEKLKGPYLVDPSVSVSIMEYRPFYVTGEVEKPGSYSFHPGLTVERAISIAGGFTERASKNRIYVVQDNMGEDADGKSIKKDKAKLADVVRPGDVITIEQGFF
ncbi:MAG: capsular biosynthesis protein [Thalassolituus sp.]|nr:MAG: capsular biosynthesis protein [Thalassolituus sp.]